MNQNWSSIGWKINSKKNKKYESPFLNLNCNKARKKLNWQTALNFEESIKLTVDWYRYYYENKGNTLHITNNQIKKYIGIAKGKGLFWAL